LDPVVASKIIFTKSVQDLQNHIPEDSLPSLITGDASKPSFDERTVSEPPRPGRISIPADDADVKSYWINVVDYEKKTTEWAESNQESLLERLKLGQSYRISRVKAEKLMRGETSYHAKGMININKDDRLIVSYKTSSWDSKDITDWV
jgi:phosphoribosyl-AMP cyclohydrolase